MKRLVPAALLLVVALSACSPDAPAPTPSGSSTDTPMLSDAPTPAAADRPSPRFGDGCAALVPETLLAAIFPFSIAPHEFLSTEYAGSPSIPRHGAVAQLGGMLCEWSNGEPYSSETGASAFRGIQLAVLPDATEGWEYFASVYGVPPGGDYVGCEAASDVCWVDAFADGYWFSATLSTTVAAGTEAAVRELADHLRAEAAGFGPPGDPWTPDGVRTMPDDCSVVLPESVVVAIHGADAGLSPIDAGGGWSLWADAWSRVGGLGCSWIGETGGTSAWWLTGGAWLARELGVTANGVAVDIPALDSEGVARLTCFASGECRIDVVAHGTWLSGSVVGAPDPEAGARLLGAHLAGVLG